MIADELDLGKPLIFELPAVFKAVECAYWIARIQSAETELAPINTRRGSQVNERLRCYEYRFNYLLGGVWRNAMTEEVWQRVQAARLHVW